MQLDLELKVHHKYHSQYESWYNSVCILRYMSYKIQLVVIPNLYISFKEVIQDASCSLTKKQLLSHRNQSGVLFQLHVFILISMTQFKLINVITSFTWSSTIVVRLITAQLQVLRSFLQM